MRTWWKVLIGLTVGLPMAAYVTGSLLASSAVSPPRPDPVVIEDATRPSTGATPTLRPSPLQPATSDDDDGDDDGAGDDDGPADDGAPNGDGDDNGVEIVIPKPTGVDDDDDGNDDDDDRDSGGDDGDDDSRDGDD